MQFFSNSKLQKKSFLALGSLIFFFVAVLAASSHVEANPQHHFFSDAHSDPQHSDADHGHFYDSFVKKKLGIIQVYSWNSFTWVVSVVVLAEIQTLQAGNKAKVWSSRAPPRFSITS